MRRATAVGTLVGYGLGFILIAIGIANLFLVHPVPGIAFLLFAAIFFPPVSPWLDAKLGGGTASVIKYIIGFVLIWFTIGISDLGEIMGF